VDLSNSVPNFAAFKLLWAMLHGWMAKSPALASDDKLGPLIEVA